MIGLVRADLRRAFVSWRFSLAVLAIAMIRLAGSSLMFYGDVISSYMYSSEIYEMNIALCALPFVSSYAIDFSSKAYMPLVLRCGMVKYAVSKLIVLFISVTLCNALGHALYVAILRFHEPFMDPASQSQYLVFSEYVLGKPLLGNHPILFLLAQVMCSTVVCLNFAVVSFVISTINTTPLFVYALPILLYYAVAYIVWTLHFPFYLVPSQQFIGYLTQDPGKDLRILLGGLTAVWVICSLLFILNVRRRLRNA